MTDTPTFSVLLPFFNDRETLGEAIESVLAQTYESWELLAIDDGSNDGSAELADGFAANDARIRVLHRPNGGGAAARNTGLAVAQGRYCALLDADDLWLPAKLERQLPLLEPDTVVFSDAYVEEDGARYLYGRRAQQPDGVYPRGRVFDELLRHNFIPSNLTAVVPTELLRSVGGFDATMPRPSSPDWELWLRLALADIRFDFVAEPLAVYRIRGGSQSQNGEAVRKAVIVVLRKMRERTTGSKRTAVKRRLRIANRELEVFHRKWAWEAAASGDARAARQSLIAALRANPRSARAVAGVALVPVPPLVRWYARRQPPTNFAGRFVHDDGPRD